MKNTSQNVFEKATEKSQAETSLLNLRDPDINKTFRRALENKTFILGKEKKDKDGLWADWTHFDFLLAAHGKEWRQASTLSYLTMLRMFWATLWKYLGPVLQKYEKLTEDYNFLLDENEYIVYKHSELKIKADMFEHYVKKKMTNSERMAYRQWYKEEKSKIDDKLKKIKEDNKEKIKEEERIKQEAIDKGYLK